MYPDEGTSRQALLPAGPSSGSHQLTTGNVGLEGIVVDNPSNDPQDSKVSVAVPKPRPLNLADDYKIVGGVPAFFREPSQDFYSYSRLYATSYDDTRIAVLEGARKICVYNMLDNFSLVAEWEGASFAIVYEFAFHNNQNNEFVVVYRDSTVLLVSFSHEFANGSEQPNASLQQTGVFEIKQMFRVLNKYKDIHDLHFEILSHEVESWICAYDNSVENIVALCSIKQSGFQRLEIMSDEHILPMFVNLSILQKAIMLVSFYSDKYKPRHTQIWTNLNFSDKINIESPIELSTRQGFGFSDCGSYFLAWKYSEVSENAMEAYDVRLLKTSTNPIAWRSIGRDVLRARGQFVQVNQALLEVLGHAGTEKSLIAAFLVTSSSKVELMLWDILPNKVSKKKNLTMKEMTFSDPYHVEFCISSNMKWVAIGALIDGIFGLFSLSTGALVWSINLDTSNYLFDTYTPLKFNSSNSKLIVDACEMLYVFAPPCLLEDYQLEFSSTSLDLVREYEDLRPPLNVHHQLLIPKHILKQTLIMQDGSEMQYHNGVLDVASSKSTSNIALLVQRCKSLMVIQGSAEMLLTSTFTKYIESDRSRDALPDGIVELRLDFPLLQRPQDFAYQQVGWIFLYPSEDTNEDSTAIFLTQNGFQGVFIDITGATNQVKIPFGDEECFSLKQSKDGNIVACLHAYGVTTIDLNKKSILYQVSYGANLAQWLVPYITTRNQSCFDVSCDATSILIGWDVKNEKPMLLTSQMDDNECETMFEENEDIIPCWWINESSTIVAFLEFDDEDHAVSAICLYNCESNALKRINIGQWNLHIKQVLGSLRKSSMHEYALQSDESNGHLWIIALHERDDALQLTVVPLHSYSHEDCIPCFSMEEYLIEHNGRLEE